MRTTDADTTRKTKEAGATYNWPYGTVQPQADRSSSRGFKDLTKDFLLDQRQIWTSPARLQFSDTEWLVPTTGFAAGLFVTDRDFSKHLSNDPTKISHYKTLSDAGVAALVGGAGGMWLLGRVHHDAHWSETGFLSGEAALNSLVAVEALKYSLRRERPFQGDGSGAFFQGGTSFPSEHAAAAWAVAGVIAHEYPGPLTKILAYGLASAVSYSRVRARQHFPSDVFIGGTMGNFIAQDIYSRHHDPELGGEAWRSIGQILRDSRSSPGNMGSPYVPLDSWIYPALDRLAALGIIESGFAGIRPWTRRECARLVGDETGKANDGNAIDFESQRILRALQREFAPELDDGSRPRAEVESLYTRTTGVVGPPLTDGHHFGQTFINDYGRPYSEGVNNVTGFSAWAQDGRLVVYIRGEYQHAPFVPALPEQARKLVSSLDDGTPLEPATGTPSVDRFRLLDGYIAMNLENWQISFGKQTLWWGPGEGGPLTISDNIDPINMFRINRVSPLKLPGILGWLGPIRTEFFVGQIEQQFVLSPRGLVGQPGQWLSPQPFLNGQKISFKPTPNFEFGFHRTTIYGGPGYPFTARTFVRSLLSTGNQDPGAANKAGNRTSGLDFSYRLPYLRDWITFYGDGYTDDQYSPIAYADRSAWRAGLYFSHIPKFRQLDLRVEGVYTDNPVAGLLNQKGTLFYADGTWLSGYTNEENLIGSWIGRESQGAQASSTYWLSPRNKIQFSYRHQKVSKDFVPQGGTLTDGGVHMDFLVRPNVSLSGSFQYETWNFPVLALGARSNVAASMQLTYWPHLFSDWRRERSEEKKGL